MKFEHYGIRNKNEKKKIDERKRENKTRITT